MSASLVMTPIMLSRSTGTITLVTPADWKRRNPQTRAVPLG
jgi:hypothetical protein